MPTNYAKDILGNLSKGMHLALCTMSPPTFQNTLPPLLMNVQFLEQYFDWYTSWETSKNMSKINSKTS